MRDWKRFPDSRAAALLSRGLRGGMVMTKRGRKRHQGALAQLVARFHGMEEVRGSSPLSSTHYFPWSGAKRIGVISALCLVLVEHGGQNGGLAGVLVRLEKVIHRFRAASWHR